MKFNDKLNLVEYIQVVNEIANEFFDSNTYEYTPQIGEIYSVCAYFNHCVELEDSDMIKTHPIEDIMDMQQLYDNEEFMEHYNSAISNYDRSISLLFGNAYWQAIDIVDYKKNDANSFAIAISAGMNAILKSFKDSFSDDDINKYIEIAKQITNGNFSSEMILNAYENKHFQDKEDKSNVIPFSQNK